jgi:hypothetical protein
MAYFDMIIDRAGNVSPVTISHMTKSLNLLQTDLGADDRATAEVTIATIITFTMVAFVSGNTDSAQKHLQGLFKVLAMRGGLGSLRTCTYLQTKCCRLVSQSPISNFQSTYYALDSILVTLCALAQSPFSSRPTTYPGIRISQDVEQHPQSVQYTC